MKVAQSHMGAEHVLNYLGPGGFFGEIGLLADLPEVRPTGRQAPPGGPRPARRWTTSTS